MAIGNTDFTAKEKKGLAWYFGVAETWELIEPPLIAWLKQAAEGWRLQKNEQSQSFKIDLAAIEAHLRDDPSDITVVKTTLGI